LPNPFSRRNRSGDRLARARRGGARRSGRTGQSHPEISAEALDLTDDIATAALFAMTNTFMTGMTLKVDGGEPLV
jgi:NAD(P)-dependent dehydrogenase (short-subunit alcohol dehydrogenase family)